MFLPVWKNGSFSPNNPEQNAEGIHKKYIRYFFKNNYFEIFFLKKRFGDFFLENRTLFSWTELIFKNN